MNQSTSATQPSLSEKLLKFMENENRPYAFSEIHERLGKQHSKQAIQKAIESRVARNQIIEKTYGKQKIYCVNNKLGNVNNQEMKLDLKTTNDKIHKYTKLNAEHQESIREIEQQLKTKSDEIPLPVLEAEHEKIAASINKLRLRADEIRQRDASTLTPEDFAKLQRTRDKALEEFHKRKRLCMNLIDGIMEGYPKSKQKLIEDTEIETDEAAGFDINQYK